MIPYGKQEITQEDIDAVVKVLKSDFITQGPIVPEFEQALADCCAVGYGVAVNSGTAALHVACLALGVGVGDRVWTSPITFVASANCARYCGAEVDFVDIDPLTYNMSVSALERKLEEANASGELPKVVIPVHLCGQSCEMKKIRELATQYGFLIIEDACHALGGKYKGKPIGNCNYADITVFSFHPVKMITTAEGGMAMTNSHELAERMRQLRSHGISRDPAKMTSPSHGSWYYQQLDLGFNYRLTDIQAGLGLSQLRRLDSYTIKRNSIAKMYNTLLKDFPVITPFVHQDAYSSFHLYVIRIDEENNTKSHKQIFEHMRSAGIGVNIHYIPVYSQPYYQQSGFEAKDFPEAERYYQTALSLPIYPTLCDEQIETVATTLEKVLLV